jgi:hypothetical protein
MLVAGADRENHTKCAEKMNVSRAAKRKWKRTPQKPVYRVTWN